MANLGEATTRAMLVELVARMDHNVGPVGTVVRSACLQALGQLPDETLDYRTVDSH
jgi:hypothetical protein